MPSISFDATREEHDTVHMIVTRAMGLRPHIDRLSLTMDLLACHANGCPMDFHRLYAADGLNFAHDVFGIMRHMDRTTGQLTDHFLPRFAKPEPAIAEAEGKS